jgi:hypothetical protein
MKKIIIFIIAVIIIIVSIIGVKYYSYKVNYNIAKQENSEYEEYKDKEITGIEVATLINKSVDKNARNQIEQTEDGNFIQNDENSIELAIYMKDTDITYNMETIYNKGTEQFVQYCGSLKFKCSKIEYHKKTGKISYILFEEI